MPVNFQKNPLSSTFFILGIFKCHEILRCRRRESTGEDYFQENSADLIRNLNLNIKKKIIFADIILYLFPVDRDLKYEDISFSTRFTNSFNNFTTNKAVNPLNSCCY